MVRWYQLIFVGLAVAMAVSWLASRIAPGLDVTHVTVDVAPRKLNGKGWDGRDGLPDPKIELRQGRETLARCPAVIDRLHVECDLDTEIAADRRDVRLIVRDEDDVIDDDIGEVILWPVSNDTVVRDHVQSIVHLQVDIMETSGWQRYGATLLAIGSGIATVITLWLVGLGRFVRRRDASGIVTAIAGGIALFGFAIEARLMGSNTFIVDSIDTFGTVAVARGLGAGAIALVWCAAIARTRLGRGDVIVIALGIAAVVGPLPAGVCGLVALLGFAVVK